MISRMTVLVLGSILSLTMKLRLRRGTVAVVVDIVFVQPLQCYCITLELGTNDKSSLRITLGNGKACAWLILCHFRLRKPLHTLTRTHTVNDE